MVGQDITDEEIDCIDNSEDSVTLAVNIEGKRVAALLDTGAKPLVIDRGTLCGLGLVSRMVTSPSRVFGLGKSGIRVQGHVDVTIQVPGAAVEPVLTRVKVLDSEEPTLLLGREFLNRFGSVTFDWKNESIRLGSAWVPIKAAVTGGTPLFRAQTAIWEEQLAPVAVRSFSDSLEINEKLGYGEKSKLEHLCQRFKDRFARDPK